MYQQNCLQVKTKIELDSQCVWRGYCCPLFGLESSTRIGLLVISKTKANVDEDADSDANTDFDNDNDDDNVDFDADADADDADFDFDSDAFES
jgi:hypothetical protein